jgi:hypothetical protein
LKKERFAQISKSGNAREYFSKIVKKWEFPGIFPGEFLVQYLKRNLNEPFELYSEIYIYSR